MLASIFALCTFTGFGQADIDLACRYSVERVCGSVHYRGLPERDDLRKRFTWTFHRLDRGGRYLVDNEYPTWYADLFDGSSHPLEAYIWRDKERPRLWVSEFGIHESPPYYVDNDLRHHGVTGKIGSGPHLEFYDILPVEGCAFFAVLHSSSGGTGLANLRPLHPFESQLWDWWYPGMPEPIPKTPMIWLHASDARQWLASRGEGAGEVRSESQLVLERVEVPREMFRAEPPAIFEARTTRGFWISPEGKFMCAELSSSSSRVVAHPIQSELLGGRQPTALVRLPSGRFLAGFLSSLATGDLDSREPPIVLLSDRGGAHWKIVGHGIIHGASYDGEHVVISNIQANSPWVEIRIAE